MQGCFGTKKAFDICFFLRRGLVLFSEPAVGSWEYSMSSHIFFPAYYHNVVSREHLLVDRSAPNGAYENNVEFLQNLLKRSEW